MSAGPTATGLRAQNDAHPASFPQSTPRPFAPPRYGIVTLRPFRPVRPAPPMALAPSLSLWGAAQGSSALLSGPSALLQGCCARMLRSPHVLHDCRQG